MSESVLIIVDLQKGFINAGSPARLKYLPRKILTGLLEPHLFDRILLTEFVNEEDSPFEKILGWRGLKSPEEREFCPGLRQYADLVVPKTRYGGIMHSLYPRHERFGAGHRSGGGGDHEAR